MAAASIRLLGILFFVWRTAAVVINELEVRKTDKWITACEYTANGTTHWMDCGAGRIQVVQAFFGAWAQSTSQWCDYIQSFDSCIVDATTKLALRCNGNARCSLPSNVRGDFKHGFPMFDIVGYEPCAGVRFITSELC
jgi:hypothetical protein